MKSRLQRWGNNKIIVSWCTPLWDFIHGEGCDAGVRLLCFRQLGDISADTVLDDDKAASVDWLVTTCHTLIVQFLLKFAQGPSGIDKTCTTPKKKLRKSPETG